MSTKENPFAMFMGEIVGALHDIKSRCAHESKKSRAHMIFLSNLTLLGKLAI